MMLNESDAPTGRNGQEDTSVSAGQFDNLTRLPRCWSDVSEIESKNARLRSRAFLIEVAKAYIRTESAYDMRYNVNVIYERDEHGYYVYCPQLKGCHSQGDTFEEARNNIQEAVVLYLDTMPADEIAELLGHEIITSTLEVAIA